ncbi:MAG: hypothetical protein NWR96_03825 [Crocinitomicaceae bacterium]|jgi:hypothetical protein|nr:hypothetical protein [Crocinitomicaceae bacterium]MDP4760739.1 hypothetical protein [Crocinitomicaceae bacterium]
MRHLLLATLCASSFLVYSATRDTLRFQLHGLIDGYSVLGKKNDLGKVPYLVSSSNMNSFQINLNLF